MFGSLGIHIDLRILAAGVWLLTFLQVIVPVLQSLPQCQELSTVQWVTGENANVDPNYTTMTGSKVTVGDAVHTMAEAVGMASLTAQGIEYPDQKEIKTREDETSQGRQFSPKRSLHHVVAIAARVQSRVAYAGFLENALQLNLQVTLLGITRSGTDSPMTLAEGQVMASICISTLMTLTKLKEAWTFLEIYRRVTGAIEVTFQGNLPADCKEECQGTLKALAFTRLQIILWSLALCAGLGYALVKLGAVVYCEDSLFNVTGCVELA